MQVSLVLASACLAPTRSTALHAWAVNCAQPVESRGATAIRQGDDPIASGGVTAVRHGAAKAPSTTTGRCVMSHGGACVLRLDRRFPEV